MSWRDRLPPTSSTRSNNPNFTAEAREKRRQELEAKRLEQAKKRKARQAFLQAGVSAPSSPTTSRAPSPVRQYLESQNLSLQSSAVPEEEDLISLPGEKYEVANLFDFEVAIENIMADFDTENGTDGEKALGKLGSIKCEFDKNDIEYWFSELEGQLEVIEVKSQWLKRTALQRFLPPEIKAEAKTLFKITKGNAGNDIYKRIKAKLVNLYGQKPEDAYARAKARVMTGKPSQLGEALVDDICRCDVKLSADCCAVIIWGMFREALPVVIRNHIAQLQFNKDTYQNIFTICDQIHDSNQGPDPSRGQVASVSAAPPKPQPEVAAVATQRRPRNNNRGNSNPNSNARSAPRSSTGNSQTSSNNSSSNSSSSRTSNDSKENKGPRHATAVGDKLCKIHHKWGSNGSYCAAPWMCAMKNVWKAPQ